MFLHYCMSFILKYIALFFFLTDAFTCTLPADRGTCQTLISIRYFYNATSEKCEQFSYGGCGGNKNNFIFKKDCEARCNNTGEKF